MFGAGGGTSSYREVEETDVVLLWGSNARAAHPIWFHHLLKGIRNGARLYVVDPRRTTSAQWADVWAGLDVGTGQSLQAHQWGVADEVEGGGNGGGCSHEAKEREWAAEEQSIWDWGRASNCDTNAPSQEGPTRITQLAIRFVLEK